MYLKFMKLNLLKISEIKFKFIQIRTLSISS